MSQEFRRLLLDWYARLRRDLPWRHTSDPYGIWVSEIMLQQTRVAAVIPYYERFLSRFPTIESLAAAGESELLAAWSGLGYYSRVRNMHKAAVAMAGEFPRTYDEVRALPGVGDYTAAAIASIAYGLPHAAADGNVFRVLARITNDSGDIATPAVRKRIAAVAERLLDRAHPGEFNQAMMELGATVCLPRDPQCLLCPVQSLCAAYSAGTQSRIPVKGRKAETVRLTRTVYVVEQRSEFLLWQRPAASRKLAGFWELPEPEHLVNPPCGTSVGCFRHSITNHNYTFEVRTAGAAECRPEITHTWLSAADLKSAPVSTTAKKAFRIYHSAR